MKVKYQIRKFNKIIIPSRPVLLRLREKFEIFRSPYIFIFVRHGLDISESKSINQIPNPLLGYFICQG